MNEINLNIDIDPIIRNSKAIDELFHNVGYPLRKRKMVITEEMFDEMDELLDAGGLTETQIDSMIWSAKNFHSVLKSFLTRNREILTELNQLKEGL